jgi:hypothetical protein
MPEPSLQGDQTVRILVGKVFGIGNAVMAVPMIKALQYKPDAVVDILIGSTPDDVGAFQVLSKVVRPPGKIYVGSALECDYDVAVMAIPFDGRWQNGAHFRATKVLDGRTRPDPSTTGLISWKDHEANYQMENARSLGFQDYDPKCSFLGHVPKDERQIYIGVGYKKDTAGFWKVKHWGNDNYAKLINLLLARLPCDWKIVTTGDMADLQLSIGPIMRAVNNSRFQQVPTTNLDDAFHVVASSRLYIGNDTGMMHVASSAGCDVLAMFFLENSIVKSRPLHVHENQECMVIDGTKDRSIVTPEYVCTGAEVILCG